MLWYKSWLETRWRLGFGLAWTAVQLYATWGKTPADPAAILGGAWLIVAVFPVMLGGAGIATQPSFQAAKGLHGSMYFTLSLPVSRLRLLAVRAALGWLEMCLGIGVLCVGLWTSPAWRASPPLEALEHTVAMIGCASALYSITMLLATFLDEVWRVWGSILAYGGLWWLSSHAPWPASMNIFRAMGAASPLVAHAMPWGAMGFALVLAASLFFASLTIVRAREY